MGLVPSHAAVLGLLSATVLAAGCTGDLASGTTGPMASPPAPSTRALAAWADGVCAGAGEVERTVRDVALVMPVEGVAPAVAREQVDTRVRRRLDILRGDVSRMGVRVGDLPPGAPPGFTALRDHLTARSARVQDAVDALAAVAATVGAPTIVPAGNVGLPALRAAVTAAVADVAAYVADVHRLPADADRAVGRAFATAPACRPPPRRRLSRPATARRGATQCPVPAFSATTSTAAASAMTAVPRLTGHERPRSRPMTTPAAAGGTASTMSAARTAGCPESRRNGTAPASATASPPASCAMTASRAAERQRPSVVA
jgi:hypothetical protein